ncbi:MAG: DNA polymerase III subunit alpha [Bacteroidales bacterium]|nr:DNA polymerase III subunit alpha [Bacteroidales bacterium]
MTQFTHLHVHSHYSMLDGMSKLPDLVEKAKRCGMYSLALTDHGNMFGVKDFLDTVAKSNGKAKSKIKEIEAKLTEASLAPEGKDADITKMKQELERLQKEAAFKPIVGIEAYCARRTLYDKDKNLKELNPETGRERVVDSSGYHLILLAKNLQGYHSLCKLASIAYTDGFYNRPRIDHATLAQYKEGVIVCSACLGGEVPQLILAGKLDEAEAAVVWFKEQFGEDYYIELMRHPTQKPNANRHTYELQQRVNPVLIDLARKHSIKLVATNDAHFVEEEHGEAHDHLICLATQKDYDDPNRMHYTKQEWLKSPEEMAALFADLPEALANTMEVAAKVETYSIDSDPLMPVFPIPESFGREEDWNLRFSDEDLFNEFTRNEKGEVVMEREAAEKKIKKLGGYTKLRRIKFEADYLEYLVWQGARQRYLANRNDIPPAADTTAIKQALTPEQRDRIIFELHTIKTMGFPGYFLIVSDYIRAAREELDVSVGPGRGSAAGSVVAYCLRITDLDPLHYDLLFERFLNPDRISLPDIDVDFDDAGRGKVLDWVTKKYGKERVAHIITYGTMASKNSIADVGRVEKIPLGEVNRVKALIPDRFPDSVKDESGKTPKITLHNCYKYVPELKSILQGEDPKMKQMLTYAEELEGTNRQIGIHACGVIIGSQDITNVAPVCVVNDKESGQDVLVTQYDGHVVENVGLIKMDFLGLKNLTIIKNCIRMVKKRTGEDIDIDHLPLDDELTYKLFCEGNTVGVFQFESVGMQKYLRELQPHVIGDLIAMNALYRPGPMDNIPEFIERKQGRKAITYDLPVMEKYLKDTYGITVYQEQVMLLSRLLAGFTRGQSDTLRKAMGKKQIEKMNELEVLFYEGGEKNGHPRETLSKIWEEWKKFASYAFNKSHAACYSWVAYQTAYLKAHYPAEYMAAVMTSAQSDIKRVTELMDDCRKQGVEVAAPSVNDSDMDFSVDSQGRIRFGLQAISGMGEAASSVIIGEREKNGPYTDIFDFLKRVDMHSVNKKNIEVLVKSGAFDGLGSYHRAQYLYRENDLDTTPPFLDTLVRWAIRQQDNASASQMSIFSMSEDLARDEHPTLPQCEPLTNLERCRYEKEVLGTYLSGHPLDDYRYEIKAATNITLDQLANLDALVGREVKFAGLVSSAKEIVTKKGEPCGSMTIEDYSGSYELRLFGDEYSDLKGFFTPGTFVYCRGRINSSNFTDKKTGQERTFVRLRLSTLINLGGVLDRFASQLTFKVELSSINEAFTTNLAQICKKHKGKVPLRAIVVDSLHDLSLTMSSPTLLVSPRDLIPDLQQFPGVYGIQPILRQ